MSRQYWVISTLIFFTLIFASCQSSGIRLELARDYYNIGNAYSDLDDYEKAASYYKRALDLDPDINQAAYNLARTSLELEDYDYAVKLLSDLEKEDGSNLMILEMLGYSWYRRGDDDKARVYYLRCLEIDPASQRSLYNMSLLEKQNRNWGMSRLYLERLLDLEEKKEYRVLLAELAVSMEDYEEAILYYEDLVVEYEGDSDVYLAMKDLYLKTEHYYKALEMLETLADSGSDAEMKAGYYFEMAKLEFELLDDPINGLQNLKLSLENGYSERESLLELIDLVEPAFKSEVSLLAEEYVSLEEPEEDGAENSEDSEKDSSVLQLDKAAVEKAESDAGN